MLAVVMVKKQVNSVQHWRCNQVLQTEERKYSILVVMVKPAHHLCLGHWVYGASPIFLDYGHLNGVVNHPPRQPLVNCHITPFLPDLICNMFIQKYTKMAYDINITCWLAHDITC